MESKEKMETNLSPFYNISIRGRAAYGILCLRRALGHIENQLDNKMLNFVFSSLESYVTVDFHPRLELKFRELTPLNILENHPDNIFNEYEYYSVDELQRLENLYKSLPDYVNDIIDSVIEIILCNLYTNIQKSHAPCSLEELNFIKKILNENMIDLPNIPRYVLESKFDQKKGRGLPIQLPPR